VSETSLGDTLVDANGMTLYLLESDTAGKSTCVDACATLWPPLTTTDTPEAGGGVTGELGTTTRADGSKQVTIDDHPLYRFSGDKKAGDTNGQEVANIWYAVAPNGEKIENENESD
jgi:predicted lipoprotein with Yx(FWY)xxD motif